MVQTQAKTEATAKVDATQALKNNTLFNEISGYAPTGGLIGSIFTAIGDFIEDISGLNDKDNERMVDNLEACKKFYKSR